MALNSHYRLSVVGSALDQTIVNTFHFKQVSATITSGLTPPNEIIRLWTTGSPPTPMTAYLGCLPGAYSARELVVINVTDPLESGSAQVAGLGSRGSGPMCPPQCSSLLSLRTIGRGRSYRGRTYIGPVLESDQDNGVMTLGIQSALTQLAFTIGASYTGLEFDWVVYSRLLDSSQRVTTTIVRTFIATQRRRSRYNPG